MPHLRFGNPRGAHLPQLRSYPLSSTKTSSVLRETTNGIRVLAPAKVNLCLRILGRRADGFHDLDTLFQAIDLFEEIEVRVGGGSAVRTGAWRAADGLTLSVSSAWATPLDETNLAVRAARAWAAAAGAAAGWLGQVALHIEKHTPIGAGLGGGSADAAGVLFALNAWAGRERAAGSDAPAPLSPVELHAVATLIGSDVAFCLRGGTARGRGRGEQLEFVRRGLDFTLILAVPGHGVPTGPAYARFDPVADARAEGIDAFVRALETGNAQAFRSTIENTFERLVAPWLPELDGIKSALVAAGCDSAFLTGSGSTICGLCLNASDASGIAARLQSHATSFAVMIARPIDHGPRLA